MFALISERPRRHGLALNAALAIVFPYISAIRPPLSVISAVSAAINVRNIFMPLSPQRLGIVYRVAFCLNQDQTRHRTGGVHDELDDSPRRLECRLR